MLKKLLLTYLCLGCFGLKAEAKFTDTLLNHKAKEIVFQQSLDKKIAPGFYHGKVLVLDFWATWCVPCIAGFPHFNELSKKYSKHDVVFAAITNEPASVARRFFDRTKKELDAIKLIDTTKVNMNTYGILTPTLMKGIPYCVIIDKDNIVRWMGNTYDLTSNIIDDVLHPGYVPPNMAVTQKSPAKEVNKPIASRALFFFNVARSDTNKRNYEGNSGSSFINNSNILQLKGPNEPLADVIEQISGYSKSRFITNTSSKLKQYIDIDYNIGRDTTRFSMYNNLILKGAPAKNFVLSLLGDAFKFDAKIILQIQKHYELVVDDTAKLHSFQSMNKYHSGYDFDHMPAFEIVGFNLKTITTYLESCANLIITTRIQDKNNYDLSLNLSSIDALNKSLRFHGLKLIEVTDAVEMMNIDFY